MKIGVLGLGAISPYFLAALEAEPRFHLAAVCDRDETKLAPFARRGVPTYADVTALLDAGVVEAVIVTLPNHLHAWAGLAALRRRVHVCCEKPLAVTVAEADSLVRAARDSGATLFTAFHRRYNANLERFARRLAPVREEISHLTARYHENILEHVDGDTWYLDPVRGGGGCLIDNGPNALDAVRHLVGPLTLRDAVIGDVRGGAEFYAALDLATADGTPVRVELDWALPTGEVKDLTAVLRDGRRLTADLLDGFDGFKESLRHEYRGILADFRAAVAAGTDRPDGGVEIVRLVEEAYRIARRREERPRMTAKDPVQARVIKLLFHQREDRGMTLSGWDTRVVRAGEVHELVTTTDRPGTPGDRVDRVGFLGFVEFAAATVLGRGDQVWIGDRLVGTLRGFDECHFPNHYNLLIESDRVLSAGDVDLRVGDEVTFAPPAGRGR